MNPIQEKILEQLNETETEYDVRIPLAVESGSRAWGFASPDSDYDCRFIYVNRPEWYLSLRERRDIIEYEADKIFDVNGWDLRKAMRQILKSNAVVFEWLSSGEIYRRDQRIADLLNRAADLCFNPLAVSYHYLSIARKKREAILQKETASMKKYVYVLRPLANLEYIRQEGKMPPMAYPETLDLIPLENEVRAEIGQLLENKAQAEESAEIRQNPVLLQYFDREIEKSLEYNKTLKTETRPDVREVDRIFREILERVWAHGT